MVVGTLATGMAAFSHGSPVLAGAGVLIFLLFGAVWVASLVYWIIALVEVIRTPDQQFRAAGTEKTTWILIVVLAGIVGALVWRFAKRRDVLAAAGQRPAPPPGWYPDASAQGMRWWDGAQWTEAVHRSPTTDPNATQPS